MMIFKHSLYADGGVIKINPSPVGGTWAFRLLEGATVLREESGLITPSTAGTPTVSNNLSEMLALLLGLKAAPDDFCGTVYSDSQITLGRIFDGWKWAGIPGWMHGIYRAERARLRYWDKLRWVLLAGHPTKEQLVSGIGKRGHPVSEHNVWCDHACTQAARNHLNIIGQGAGFSRPA